MALETMAPAVVSGRSIRDAWRALLIGGLLATLAACGGVIPKTGGPRPTLPPTGPTTLPSSPQNALAAGVRRGPALSALRMGAADAAGALASFRESCPKLIVRKDGSGLTRPEDWRQACTAAVNWGAGSPALFFSSFFEAARIGDGSSYATGYYEPEIAGGRTPQPGYTVPVYAFPPDLVRAKPGDAPPLSSGRMPLGRYAPDGTFTSYFDRAQIDAGALAGKGLEIAWAADPVEFFFLQVQGSGRLVAPDGTVTRIGYAGQNGLPYTGIGGVMRDQGLVGSGPGQYSGSMQGIMQYVREHPVEGRALMERNRSWVFFKVLNGDGPLGALNVPVRAGNSVAVDPRYVPLGAPVYLDMDRREANGLWIAQDTGGAIKGANRFDTFWGAGSQARLTAGGMSGRGNALILLPKGVLTRLGAR
ncbi:MltA domain-containing protein [Novosphingobium resinovorum]|uniref:peptidoglycan lytic exotransglycosylase n=2 Tax=Novosphingobium resinovorum TaxID=158500 RepID=A0A031JYQ0_9SPHN|nr:MULTISPECIES: MltA domain-containing protein [Sphingomonadaceae]EJU09836.1 MltA protein [Sphingomonas sp. LH128]EZP81502.1 MltA protein [Novosphingobium resinovorum]WJM27296.1 MltA domain-containing protein [Novosphingobium resinovorum]